MRRIKEMMNVLGIVLLTVSLLLTFSIGASAQTITLKVSHQFAEGDVRDKMVRVFGDMVTEKTNGAIKFRYYPAQSLFKSKEQWDAMRKGALDMSVFPLSYASGKVPQLDITLMPALFSTMEEGLSWRNKPIGKKIEALMEENGIKNVVWAWFDGGLGSTAKQIKVPADVKGLKMRAAGKKFEFMLGEAGASITSMPSSEIYQAMATGVLDSCMTSSASFVSYRLYEQLKYMNAAKNNCIWYMSENIIMSMKTWNRLTPEQQKIFQDVAEWMHTEWILPNFSGLVDKLIEEYTKAGAEVHYMTDAEFNEWRDLAKETSWKNFADTVEGGQELLDLAVGSAK